MISLRHLLLATLLLPSGNLLAQTPSRGDQARSAIAFSLALQYFDHHPDSIVAEGTYQHLLFVQLLDSLSLAYPILDSVRPRSIGSGEAFRRLDGDGFVGAGHKSHFWADSIVAAFASLSRGCHTAPPHHTAYQFTIYFNRGRCQHPAVVGLRRLGFATATLISDAHRVPKDFTIGHVAVWFDAAASPMRDMRQILPTVRALLAPTALSTVLHPALASAYNILGEDPAAVTLDSASRATAPDAAIDLTFHLNWGDCSRGCIGHHTWRFSVYVDPGGPGGSQHFRFDPPIEAGPPVPAGLNQ